MSSIKIRPEEMMDFMNRTAHVFAEGKNNCEFQAQKDLWRDLVNAFLNIHRSYLENYCPTWNPADWLVQCRYEYEDSAEMPAAPNLNPGFYSPISPLPSQGAATGRLRPRPPAQVIDPQAMHYADAAAFTRRVRPIEPNFTAPIGAADYTAQMAPPPSSVSQDLYRRLRSQMINAMAAEQTMQMYNLAAGEVAAIANANPPAEAVNEVPADPHVTILIDEAADVQAADEAELEAIAENPDNA